MERREDWSSATGDPVCPESQPLTDDELTALALGANPDDPLDDGAIPLDLYMANTGGALPEWYMAPPMVRHLGRFGRVVILAVVFAFLLIEAFGLCSTYGQIPFH